MWLPFYRLLFPVALGLALPYYGYRMARRGGYGAGFAQRLGWMGAGVPVPDGRKRIWLHGVSVGEQHVLAPLVRAIVGQAQRVPLLTVTTSTGMRVAREAHRGRDVWTGYFPVDWWPLASAGWRALRPDLYILAESEIWPEHLWQARKRGVPALLINGRISDRSFVRMRRLRGVVRPVLQCFHRICPSSEGDGERFLELGVDPGKLRVTGNIKCDIDPQPRLDAEGRAALRGELGFPLDAPVVLGSSTWPGEERALARAVQQLRNEYPKVRLLLVPRHAERRKQIRTELEAIGERPRFRTGEAALADPQPWIYVADTTGELLRLSQAADIAFIGKSLPPHTLGQTPVECAALGIPILHGPRMDNFRTIAGTLRKAGASRRIACDAELPAALGDLLQSDAERQSMSRAALQWHASHRGAISKTLEVIESCLA